MTLSDQVAARRQDGRVTDETPSASGPARPRRRTFTAAYKARILAAYEALPEGSSERGELLRRERLYHSHIEAWRKKAATGSGTARGANAPPPAGGNEELRRLREESKKLRAESTKQAARAEKLSGELDKTRTALDIAGKAFALLQERPRRPRGSGTRSR